EVSFGIGGRWIAEARLSSGALPGSRSCRDRHTRHESFDVRSHELFELAPRVHRFFWWPLVPVLVDMRPPSALLPFFGTLRQLHEVSHLPLHERMPVEIPVRP